MSEGVGVVVEETTQTNYSEPQLYNKIKKTDLTKVFWRLQIFGLGITLTSTSAQAIGFLTALTPVLKRLYKDKPKEERVRAMQRHLQYFLSQNTATGLILGLTAALEESTTEDEKEAVVAIKAGMMGSLAAIGDSVFKLTIQAIAGSIGAAYALQGNILGAILMFVIYNGINIGIKYYGVKLGYEKGVEYIQSGEQARVMQRIINIATMVGVVVIGGIIGNTVVLNIGTEIVTGETVVKIQELLDGAMPKLLPLLFTIGLYRINKKMPRQYLILMILGILVIGTTLAYFGILV
jgi:PTS system mannose-specific IID component